MPTKVRPQKLSGLQRQVLSLYRLCLRAASEKPASTRPNFVSYIRREFRKNQTSVDKKDFGAVEFLLRMGHRKLETYMEAGVKDIH